MLVLTRKVGETIVINNNIHITLASVRGGTVRLGVTAPPTVRVARAETVAAADTTVAQPDTAPIHKPKIG